MKALVYLHGFAGTPQGFSELNMQIEHAPYLAGHGSHPDLSSSAYDEEVERVASGIASRFDQPVHLLAYSMGARVALGVIARHPHLLRRATLVGVHPGLESDDERNDRLSWERSWIGILEQEGLSGFEEKWKSQEIFASQSQLSPEIQHAQKSARLSHTASGLVHALRVLGLGSMPHFWSTLSHFHTPTTFVYGALDQKFTKLAERAHALNPSFRLAPIPDAGHNPLLEAPQRMRELIVELEGEDDAGH